MWTDKKLEVLETDRALLRPACFHGILTKAGREMLELCLMESKTSCINALGDLSKSSVKNEGQLVSKDRGRSYVGS